MKKFNYLPLLGLTLFATIGLLLLVGRWLNAGSKDGWYNPLLNVLVCKSEWSCEHEVAHRMDRENGYPSQDPAFMYAVNMYVVTQVRDPYGDELAYTILFSDLEPIELYAWLYDRVDGNLDELPPGLHRFYSDDESYIKLQECLLGASLRLCDRSLRIR